MDLRDKVCKAICVYMDTHAAHAQTLYVQMNEGEHALIGKAFDEAASGLCEPALSKEVICAVWEKSVERRAAEASLGPSAEVAAAPPDVMLEGVVKSVTVTVPSESVVSDFEKPEIAPE
jgi:hypothetical protein